MDFHGKSGQEFRTWILFIVGIGLVGFFAYSTVVFNRNPLNPWWTLIIGAFTCTAVIVSAVQNIVGGIQDAAKKAEKLYEDRDRDSTGGGSKKPPPTSFSNRMGFGDLLVISWIRRRYTASI